MSENKESVYDQIQSVGYADIYTTQDLEDIIDLELEGAINISGGKVHCQLIKRRAENREDSK